MARVDPQNILLIHFGQLGDVVLALPALRAVRERFADSRLTVMSGTSAAGVIALAGVADDQIKVDRVALRDGNMIHSVADIFRLVKDIRKRRFDFVIDMHSLYETNLVGWLSGARQRLFSHRDRRSIQWLSNFPVKPTVEDRTLHHTDRYLAFIESLDLTDIDRTPKLQLSDEIMQAADLALGRLELSGKPLIGLFLGAGHHLRRWPVEHFAAAAAQLAAKYDVLVLLGPEEEGLREGLQERFGTSAHAVSALPLDVFVGVLARLNTLVSGDTGPMHLAAAVGVGIVLLSQKGAPDIFRPLAHRLVVIDDRDFSEIDPETVVDAVEKLAAPN